MHKGYKGCEGWVIIYVLEGGEMFLELATENSETALALAFASLVLIGSAWPVAVADPGFGQGGGPTLVGQILPM